MDRSLLAKVNPTERLADIKFILDSFDAIESDVPQLRGDDGKGLLDRQRIGMAGHWAGALTTVMAFDAKVRTRLLAVPAAMGDKRIQAAILISGQGTLDPMFNRDAWSEITRPMLVITGSLDQLSISNETPESRKEPYLYAHPGDKYLLYIEGATHGSFGGKEITTILHEKPTTDIHLITDITAAATTAFWDAHLLKDGAAKNICNPMTCRMPVRGRPHWSINNVASASTANRHFVQRKWAASCLAALFLHWICVHSRS